VDCLHPPRSPTQLGGGRAHEAFPELRPVECDQLDRVARLEGAVAPDDSDGEEAAAVFLERRASPVVDDDRPTGRLGVAEPEAKGARGRSRRREACPSPLARHDRRDGTRAVPGGDHRRDPGGSRKPSGRDLALHPAPPVLARGAEPDAFEGAGLGEELCAWIGGMRGVDALDLGQEHEQPRSDEHCELRRERVVVAEGDLVRRGRIVLVHDRDDSEPQQRRERAPHVQVRGALGEVGGGE